MKLCLVCSVGGHLSQMLQLKDVYNRHEHFFVTFKNERSKNLGKKEKVYFLNNPLRNPLIFFLITIKSLILFFREFPDVIITTGANIAFPLCFFGRIFGRKIIFIESFSRVKNPSLFGRFVKYFSNIIIVQWRDLKKKYRGSIYGGPIYNTKSKSNITAIQISLQKNSKSAQKLKEKKSKRRKYKYDIFFISGTGGLEFDRPLRELEILNKNYNKNYKIIAQTGVTTYKPNFENFKFCSSDKIEEYIKKSRLIITHDGAGSILTAMKYKKPIVIVPRQKEFGEIAHSNLDLAKKLEHLNFPVVWDIKTLERKIVNIKKYNKNLNLINKRILEIIKKYLNKIERELR